MRVFVFEYVSSGAWPDGEPPESLAREGLSMLSAILADFARIDSCRVVTTCDSRLREESWPIGVEVISASNPADELSLFERLSWESDATLVIAPEFDGILADRCRLVEARGGRLLGPAPDAVQLCADKYALANHLQRHNIPTIATSLVDEFFFGARDRETSFPIVVKPRDGAGSMDVRLIASANEVESVDVEARDRHIVQSYIAGNALSVSAIVSPDEERVDVFPVGRQRLSGDGTFQYLGGEIPFVGVDARTVRDLIYRTIRSIPGLNGYIGFDLIRLADQKRELVICEINPRLTTSYLGYRALTQENLVERLLFPEKDWRSIAWTDEVLSFLPDGTISRP